jgi:hypothetical protein
MDLDARSVVMQVTHARGTCGALLALSTRLGEVFRHLVEHAPEFPGASNNLSPIFAMARKPGRWRQNTVHFPP